MKKSKISNKKKIALFHPWIKSYGGAERLVLEFLKNTKYDIDIYTWIYDKNKTFPEFRNFNIKIVSPRLSKYFSRKILLRGLIFSLISPFSKIDLKKYDSFLISTSGVAEFITFRNKIKGRTFAYVHTPLRESSKEDILWNLEHEYKNFFKKIVYLTAIKIYSFLEKISWKNLDVIIFNSNLSLSRAKQRLLLKDKAINIVYPPITLIGRRWKLKRGNYFLYFSRYTKRKRQDLLVRAWNTFSKNKRNRGYKLVLAGNSEDKVYFNKVKKLASKNKSIEIYTELGDEKISKLISECYATFYIPYLEDWGMIPFEVLAIGKPLAAIDKAGYVGILKEGIHFHPIREKDSPDEMKKEIVSVLKKLISIRGLKDRKFIFKNLSSKKFTKKLEKIIDK